MRQVSTEALTFYTIPTGRPDLRTPVDGIAVEIDRDAVQAFVRPLLRPATTPPVATPGPSGPDAPPTALRVTDDDPVTVQRADAPEAGSAPAPATSSPPVITANGVPCVD
jgi:hypothetical protein